MSESPSPARGVPAGYALDDDRDRVDQDVLWDFLSTQAYWGRFRTRAQVQAQVASAFRVVAAYSTGSGAMVGFARSWSDGVSSAYLGDVFVLPGHRGRGLATAMVDSMINTGPGAGLRWMLHTADAHELYARFGFAPPGPDYLERPRPG